MGFLRKLFKKRLTAWLGGGLAGLLAMGISTDVAAPTMKKAAIHIANYCDQPETQREKLREAFYVHTMPNRVEIQCVGDVTE